MRANWLLILGVVVVLGACGGGSHDADATKDEAASSSDESEGQSAGEDRNACHLLSHEEVSELVGRTMTMRDQTEASDTYSTCDYSNAEDQFAFGMTVYWEGGKEQWEVWQAASGMAKNLFEEQEGVDINEIVSQGPVAGVGDAAFFSELLPSLILKGDILFELNLALVPEAGKKFRGLAEKSALPDLIEDPAFYRNGAFSISNGALADSPGLPGEKVAVGGFNCFGRSDFVPSPSLVYGDVIAPLE